MLRADPVIHVIDDDLAVLKALGRLLASAGHAVQCHASAEAFLQCHDPTLPGCAIVDLSLPGMDGFGVQDSLATGTLARPVIFLTGAGDIPSSVKAMKAGAIDFLTKPVDAVALLAAVGQALQRDAAARSSHMKGEIVARTLESLTPRERQVIDRVVAGRLNKQIAGDLGTAEKTVKVHRGRTMKKMGVRTVADLIRLMSIRPP